MIRNMAKTNNTYLWIALQDQNDTGEYSWLTRDGNLPLKIYTNWKKYEPRYPGGCVVIQQEEPIGLWEVKNCMSFKAMSLCKQESKFHGENDPHEEPHFAKPFDSCMFGWESSHNLLYCYKVFHSEKVLMKRSWAEAEALCQDFGANLASFTHASEEDFLNKLLNTMFHMRDRELGTFEVFIMGTKLHNMCFLLQIPKDQSHLKSWYSAQTFCNRYEASLASIESEVEQAFITMNLFGHKSNVWIGLQSNDYAKWINGQEVEYSNWSPVEVMQASAYEFVYTSRYTLDPSVMYPIPNTLEYANRTYILINGSMTWYMAFKTCKENGADLASIADHYHQAFLTIIVNRLGYSHWIGLFISDVERNLTTNKGWCDEKTVPWIKFKRSCYSFSTVFENLNFDEAFEFCEKQDFHEITVQSVKVSTRRIVILLVLSVLVILAIAVSAHLWCLHNSSHHFRRVWQFKNACPAEGNFQAATIEENVLISDLERNDNLQ
ncbi:hypothetical protein JD844_022704 [Phrynosoma platyrhinos]|uniref:C-type lectin domain-containing protein n=1 Tax=Phrynosoma platyrhinos TaxID=52577 RepID=A0ABQ7SVF8_PHRPL|nr:hypothetical protein JD844_022704 [Phrynosoma platyrhinos]